MRHFSAWVLSCSLVLAALAGHAQGPAYGDWQLHLPANSPQQLAEVGDQLYVATDNSFYVYDKSLNTSRFLSRRDGLSDVDVRALAYDSTSAQLLIAYANGNLDLLAANGTVRNITDLLRKQSQSGKQVYQVQIFNGLAYVSTNLGVVVIDLARREVRDTYGAIGPGGRQVTAFATAVLHDTLWAATSSGILRGRLSASVNLLDYRNWTLEPADPQNSERVFLHLAPYRGHLVAASSNYGLTYVAGVGAARRWRLVPGNYGNLANRLRVNRGQLLVAFDNGPLGRFDAPTGQFIELIPLAQVSTALRDAVREADGSYFVASAYFGLLRFATPQATPERIRPNGPETTRVFGLTADAATNTVDVFTGGYGGNGGFGWQSGFYEYSAGRWTNYTPTTYPSRTDYPNLPDLLHGTRTADGTLYVASYGNGVLAWQGPGQFRQFTYDPAGRTPLRSSLSPDASNLGFVRVTDVAADPSGEYVWVVNRHQRNALSGLSRYHPADDTWELSAWAPGFENLNRVVVDGYGNPWATQTLLGGGVGVVAYDVATRQTFSFSKASTTAGVGTGLPDNSVYSLARDRKGAIWMGTAQGVAYVTDPSPLLNGQQPAFTLPYAQSGGGRFPTLYNETVRCIAVDGANRKWFGTPNGLWLFNPDADKALLNFTTANSPLPSNSIVDVAVNDKTGEVFIATDAGVVSYQGSASLTAESTPSCADVFPNPVQPEFAGTVGIRGVANNAQVKITDVAGHLVYSTTAAGGTITWNLTDTSGRRVRSGVYLVLSADAEGKNTCVSKVAVLSN